MARSSDFINVEFLGHLNRGDLDLAFNILHFVFGLGNLLPLLLLLCLLVGRLRGGLHLLSLSAHLRLNHLLLGRSFCGWGLRFGLGGFLLFVVILAGFLAVVFLQPLYKWTQQGLQLLLNFTFIENTIFV